MSKCIYKDIANNLNKEEFETYYKTHLTKDTCEHFNFHPRYLYRILKFFDISTLTREELSNIHKKFVCTEERNKKISESNKGRKFSPETIQKISDSNKGKHFHKGNCTSFKSGGIPWNKGKKGVQHWTEGQREKYFNTLKNHGWFKRKTKIEENVHKYLNEKYGEENIIYQYIGDDRYPYVCDFYVSSMDIFIEVNRFWHHGPHPFNSDDEEDLKLLNKWKEKSTESNQYSEAIKTWTIRDVNKIQTAISNHLRYILIY